MRAFQFLYAVFVAVLLLGCATANSPQLPSDCMNREAESLILSRIPDPYGASVILQLANLEAIKHNVYEVEEARAVISEIEVLLLAGVSYDFLAAHVLHKFERANDKFGAEIFLVSQYMGLFEGVELLISPCDVALLRRHLDKQRKVLLLSGG